MSICVYKQGIIYISEKKAQEGKLDFDDCRSAVAKDYKTAKEKNKNEMLRTMLNRVIEAKIKATHVIADSWFGNRDNIKAILSHGLTGVLRMKRGNLQYLYNDQLYTATELFSYIKRRMKKMKNTHYSTYFLDVKLNISDNKKKPEWITVRLLFSRSLKQKKDNWALFLSTDINLTHKEIFKIYALR